MEFFFAAAFAGLAGFLCLLSYYDLSPKTALYKIIGRFFTPPHSLRPTTTDAPYRRVRPGSHGLHRPFLLNLPTSEGSGQACHPDVVYIPDGFGAKRWPYWMVCTPYPYGNDFFENPELFVSGDGLNWSIPDGVRNPIVPPPPVAGDHNSDPDILHHANKLWLFYRETIRSEAPTRNIIYMTQSSDGVSWSKPAEILRDSEGRELLSPAVIHDGTRFVMWTIEIHDGEFKIVRRFSENGLQWSLGELGSVTGIDLPRHLWHIDVVLDDDRLSAALVSCIARNGGGSRLHYACSLDGGLSWNASEPLFDQTYEFESQLQYRATLRKCADPSQGCYQLWYSAASSTNMFSIAYLQLFRKENTLVPFEPHRG